MSYRELRNFTEMMQTLGYPRIISMENFRLPNFSLVAEILSWLIQRYDPMADIITDIDTEQDRVIFIKSAAQLMSSKAHIKLNTKKLYGADGYAVKELIKIASLLYSAMRSNETQENKSTNSSSFHSQLSSKGTDLKACRQLASEITTKGAKLYELLAQEVELREARLTAISRPVDIDEIEKGIGRCIESVNEETRKMNHRMDNAANDEKTLEIKIEKKRQELERNQKRLNTLANVRPAFMDEYERLEGELQQQYEIYMEKFRNLSYLEQQLEDRRRVELDMKEERESSLLEMKMQVQQENQKTLDDVIIQSGIVDTETKSRFVGNMTGEGIASDDGSASLSTGSRDDGDPLQDLQDEEEEEEEEEEEDRRDFVEGDSDEDF